METNQIKMQTDIEKLVLGIPSRDYTPVKDPYTHHLLTLQKELEYLQKKYVDIRKVEMELKTIKNEWTSSKKMLTQLSNYFNNPKDESLHISVEDILKTTVHGLKMHKKNAVYQVNIWSCTAKHRNLKDVLDKVKTNIKKLNTKFPDPDQTNRAAELIKKLEREMRMTCKARKIKEDINRYNAAVETINSYCVNNREHFDAWLKEVNNVFNCLQEKCTSLCSV